MTEGLLTVVSGVNTASTIFGGICFSWIPLVSGWVSITLISAVIGLLLLIIFKYTSNQNKIGRVRDEIKAHLLAVKIFKDNISVTLRSPAAVFFCSFRLLFYSTVPMLVMIVPVVLILSQLGMWYQYRPLSLQDTATVKVLLNERADGMPEVALLTNDAAASVLGPVKVQSKTEIYWRIKPLKAGSHTLMFRIGNETYKKQIVAGDGFMRISPVRPGHSLAELILYPLEKPFAGNSLVESISIAYPERKSHIYGTDWWIAYFFAASMIAAFLCKPFINVRI